MVEVFLLAGVYVGIALSVVWIIQLLGPEYETTADSAWTPEYGGIYTFHLDSWDRFTIRCLCIVPVAYIFHSVHLLYRIVREKAEKQAQIIYEGNFLGGLNNFLLKGANLFWAAVIALLPLLGVIVMLLVLFGQRPDSIILAFTSTSDWTLSQEISPPPVAYDAHYLCTVSLRGHKRLVKPTRYGIRRGEKKSAWSADVVYLVMKPLEWFFLFTLYLCDEKPENRINSQYLPGAPCCK